jgi:hypothetical protein
MPRLKTHNTRKSSQINAQQDLERRILHGMSCEWEAARLNLEPGKRRLISRPLFAIKDLKTQWGNWSRAKREISLRRHLVLNYPWDSIRDVLLHEMAHQIAQQLFGASAQTSHGPAFKQACAILGIDAVASAHYKPLQERLLTDTANHRDRCMIRIKKLLALAESQNRYEAEAAMLKAHELIAKYNVDISNQEDNHDFLSIFIGEPALRHPKEEYFLANLIQDFYFIRGLWVSAYVVEKEKMGRVLEISGSVENIKLAGYVYDFIRHYIDSQWLLYNRTKEFNRYNKSDFAVGVIEGFRSKLTSHTRINRKMKNYLALVRSTDSLLEHYFSHKYPHTVNIRKKVSHQNETILNDGKKLGKQLVITKGVSGRNAGGLRLIGPLSLLTYIMSIRN